MINQKLGFFIAAMTITYLSHGQSNTLGDRAPATAEEQHHKIQKQKISKKQKLLFHKVNVKHTARYEFYVRIEKAAKEKQRLLKKMGEPQYSDFTYFGHKHKPKRHLPF